VIQALIARVRRSVFAQGILSIAGGTVIGQGIGVLVSPLLTRLYTPEAMGMWGLFISFVGVATAGGALRYEVAVVAAKEDSEALSLAGHTFLLAVLTSLVGGAVFEAFRRHSVLGYEVFPWWSGGLIVLAIIVNVWGQVLRFWFIREKKFQSVGYFVAGRGALRAAGQIVLYPWNGLGLIGGEIIGRLASLGVLLRDFPVRAAWWAVLSHRKRSALRKYKKYPLVFLPSAFVDTMALMAPIPVFAASYGVEVGGMLSLAQRVVSVPLIFLGGAVADVFFGEIADVARRDARRAMPLFLKSTLRLGGVAFIIGIGLWLFAPWGMTMVFGAAWEVSGKMLAAMAPWFVGMLIVSPISRLVFLSRYPWVKLIYDFSALFVVVLPLWFHLPEPLEALRLVSWLQAGLYGAYWLILLAVVYQGVEAK